MKIKGVIAGIGALSLTAATSLAAEPSAPPTVKAPPVKAVDAARFYTGEWIEIGRRPMKITDGCVAGATRYTAKSATVVDVLDTCHDKTPTGKLKSLGGPAEITDPGTNAKLHVSYRILGLPVAHRDYWVLDHDDAYTWFISSDPAFENLWIYTRDPHVDPTLLKSLVARAKDLGYDVSKLEFPAQP
jgi:apolipoprotein D and lipocalin family protein